MTLHQKLLKYSEYSRHFWFDSFQNKRQKTQRNLIDNVLSTVLPARAALEQFFQAKNEHSNQKSK